MVDDGKIALSPAYQIAALKPEEQQILVTTIDYEQATPSLSQAQRMKKFSQTGKLNEDSMLAIMSEEKKSEKFSLTFDGDRIRKYFPKSYTPLQMENTIIKLLEAWQKKTPAQPGAIKPNTPNPPDNPFARLFHFHKEVSMYINTFKYTPADVDCKLCTEYVKKFGCTACGCPWMAERIEAGVVGYAEVVRQMFPHG